jgi:hypothetical protein
MTNLKNISPEIQEEIQIREKSFLKPMGKRPPELCESLKGFRHLLMMCRKMTEKEYLEKFFRTSFRRKDHLIIKTLKLIRKEL